MRKVKYIRWRILFAKRNTVFGFILLCGLFVFLFKGDTFTPLEATDRQLLLQTQGTRLANISSNVQLVQIATTKPKETIHKAVTKKHNWQGEKNARLTSEICSRLQRKSNQTSHAITVRWNKKRDVLYCPIYKVGTTFWRRIYAIDGSKTFSNLINPFEIPFDYDYPASKYSIQSDENSQVYSYMFSRDPYNRLLSFYVDKLLAPNPFYWKVVGINVIKTVVAEPKTRQLCGHDVTFPEFIKYVIRTLKTRKNIDPHWIEMEENCHPCEMRYNFIGKMETFPDDSSDILMKLNLNSTRMFLKEHGSDESDKDAIRDTLAQPFTFKRKYRACMTFGDAVKRAWRKLQIRGLINDTEAPSVLNDSKHSLNKLFHYANSLREGTLKSKRKKLKSEFVKQFWDQIPVTDLFELKSLYTRDFQLFAYNDQPEYVFQGRQLNQTNL